MLGISMALLSVAGLLGAVGLQPGFGTARYEKSTFPFTELSHFSLAYAPVVLYQVYGTSGARRTLSVLAVLLFSLLSQSMTLLVASVLIAACCRRLALVVSGALAAGSLLLAAGLAPIDLGYFTNRLQLAGEVTNLSSLAYLQGWQFVVEYGLGTHGWGVGFQQLGVHGSSVPAAEAIQAMVGLPLNVQDGSFVFAKLSSEIGVFGVVISLAAVVCAFQAVRKMRRQDAASPIVIFSRCVMVCFLIELFLRGTGYFTGSTFLAISAATVLARNQMRIRLARAHMGRVDGVVAS
jgi:hypothetical protein